MLFQGMFFIITPALICGAFAERMKFSTMVVFIVLWGTLIYCPLAHWVWGGGVLAYGSPHAASLRPAVPSTLPAERWSTSAPACRPWSAPCCWANGSGYGSEPMPPHNMTYTAIGAAMLWVGWFGFNAGSALTAGRLATSAFAATHFAAAAGGLTWAALEWIIRGKPSVLGTCSGLVAGLACITQAAGYVTLMPALLIGAIGGRGLLHGLHARQGPLRLRRFARRLRRPRRRRHAGGHPHGHLRHPRHRRPAGRRRARWAFWEGGSLLKAQAHRRRGRLGAGHRRHVRDPQGARCWSWACGSRSRPRSRASTSASTSEEGYIFI